MSKRKQKQKQKHEAVQIQNCNLKVKKILQLEKFTPQKAISNVALCVKNKPTVQTLSTHLVMEETQFSELPDLRKIKIYTNPT